MAKNPLTPDIPDTAPAPAPAVQSLPTREEADAYWASGRRPREAQRMRDEYSITRADGTVIYYFPGQEEQAKAAAK